MKSNIPVLLRKLNAQKQFYLTVNNEKKHYEYEEEWVCYEEYEHNTELNLAQLRVDFEDIFLNALVIIISVCSFNEKKLYALTFLTSIIK